MKKEIKQMIEEIKADCLIDLHPNAKERIKRTDEIHLADVLWLARNTAQQETQSRLSFSEGMKDIVTMWDLENDDLKQQFDVTITIVHQIILTQPNNPK